MFLQLPTMLPLSVLMVMHQVLDPSPLVLQMQAILMLSLLVREQMRVHQVAPP